MSFRVLLVTAGMWLASFHSAIAFPQYADWISEKSGKPIDCAYCHVNAEGPQGGGPGQIGSLSDVQLAKLRTPESPILNAFGQSLIKHLGYEGVAQGLTDPAGVAQKMKAFDMDGDGISDGDEMLYGTLPSDSLSAPPQLVWQKRLEKHMPFVLLVGGCGVAGAIALFMLSKKLAKPDVTETDDSANTSDDASGTSL